MFSELLEFLGEVNGVVLAAAHESARIQLRCVRRGEY
jgi:hypothetical protein